jgi:hypothetical protein
MASKQTTVKPEEKPVEDEATEVEEKKTNGNKNGKKTSS